MPCALGRNLEARAAYLEAVRLDPNLARASAYLGLLLQQESQLADAAPWLKQAAALEPDNPEFHQYLGELYEEWEEPGLAVPCWERVVALAPGRAEAHVGAGLGAPG